MTLDKLGVGRSGKVLSVGGEGALRCRLLEMGITPGAPVAVKKLAPMGDPIELTVRGYSLSIRRADAAIIAVRED